MSERSKVICGEHGDTPATYMCRHLVMGIACGFHAAADDPADAWPDAWCDLCNAAFLAAGGEWNDESEAGLGIKVMCTHCYEAARTRNARVPDLARSSSGRLAPVEADDLIHHAVHEAQALQAAVDGRWGILQMARWDFDDRTRTLTFTDPARPTVIADVRHVGSFSTKSSTFQWAWETFAGHGDEGNDVARVRVFGEVRGIERLTTPNWTCDEVDGWEMTSLAAYLLGAEGLYRPPFDHVRWFFLLSNLRHPS